jgi:flavodoxin
MTTTRVNKKWTVNELLSLQREYELLEMDIFEIALKHKRTPKAILYKLEDEAIINNWDEARGYAKFCDEDLTEDINDKLASVNSTVFQSNSNSNSNSNITNRLSYLESAVSGIQNTLSAIASKILPKQVRTREI